eukprot:2423300-Rhodomonas_salina.2
MLRWRVVRPGGGRTSPRSHNHHIGFRKAARKASIVAGGRLRRKCKAPVFLIHKKPMLDFHLGGALSLRKVNTLSVCRRTPQDTATSFD